MADSIVYTHSNCKYNHDDWKHKRFILVKWKNQVIICKNKLHYIKVKNLDTQKPIITIQTCLKNLPGHYVGYENFTAFMYSDCLLWIGMKSLTSNGCKFKFYYNTWLVDLEQSTCVSSLTLDIIENDPTGHFIKIIPVGSKYFIIEKILDQHYPTNVYPWAKLLELDKPLEPVHQINKSDSLYWVNWKSSSIKQLNSCELVQINSTNQLVFLDGNFNQILTLGLLDLFPDYKPNSQVKISFNANCLALYIPNTIVYCWDFTANSQVKFPQDKINQFTYQIYPIRSSGSNNVNFFIVDFDPYKARYSFEIYESE